METRYSLPSYPSRLHVLSEPALLRKNVPPAWLKYKEMASALALFLALMLVATGCKSQRQLPVKAAVAPVFIHGEGRGITGYSRVVPPVFLNEDEALQIITDELSKNGLNFSQKNVDLNEIKVPMRQEDWRGEKIYVDEIPNQTKVLNVDLLDPDKKVCVEYISNSDYFDNGGAKSTGPAQSYDTQRTAQYLAGIVSNNGKGIYFGVFYDPESHEYMRNTWNECGQFNGTETWKSCQSKYDEKEREKSRELLRLQIKGFADWLKAQGVI